MAVYLVTSADVGAPALTGQNGSGITVFDYILNTVGGLTIQDTATNKRNYVLPNGDIYHCVHDNTVTGQVYLMLCRAAESASAIDTLTNPYPNTTQVADTLCNFRVSNTSDATARAWWAILDTSATTGCFYFFNAASGSTFVNGIWWAGGTLISALPVDNYAAISYNRNNSTTSTNANQSYPHDFVAPLGSSVGRTYLKRSADGSIISSACSGSPWANNSSTSVLGSYANGPATPHPVDGKIRIAPVAVNDFYSQTAVVGSGVEAVRLWIPRMFQPLHVSGSYSSIDSGDTWADSAYGASAKFVFFKCGSTTGSGGGVVIQYDGDWSVPNG